MTAGDARGVDEVGWRILDELQKNARVSFKEIAERVNLSPTAVIERIRRMEDDGIIVGYTAVLDPRKVGHHLSALISMSTDYGNPEKIVHDMLADIPEVISCWSITGTHDFLLEVRVPSLEFLEELLTALSRHGKLTTSIVLPSSVSKRHLRPPRGGMREA